LIRLFAGRYKRSITASARAVRRAMPQFFVDCSGLTVSLLLVVLSLPQISTATITGLDTRTASVSLNSSMELLRDPSGRLTINDVVGPGYAEKFVPMDKPVNAGYTKDVIWLRFTLQKRNELTPTNWWLEVSPADLDFVTLYEPLEDSPGKFIEKPAGDFLPLGVREIEQRNFMFKVSLPDSGLRTCYLRVRTSGALYVDATIWAPHAFGESEAKISYLLGIFYGLIFLLCTFNLVLWPVLSDRLYLIYAFLLTALAVVSLTSNGYAALYLFPHSPFLVNVMRKVGLLVLLIAGSYLIEVLVPMERTSRLRRSFVAVRIFSALSIPVVISGHFSYVAQAIQIAGLYLSAASVIVLIRGIFRQVHSARIYTVAFLVYYLGGISLAVRNLNIISLPDPRYEWSFQIGIAIHMLIMQTAIGWRFHRIRREKEEELRKALNMSREKESELAARTQEWEETFNSISDMMIIVDRQRRIIKANKSAAGFLNEVPETIAARHCFELYHTDGRCPAACPCTDTFEKAKPATAEFYEPKFGRHLEVSTSPVFDASGEVVGAVHITKDVTWRKQIEEEVLKVRKLDGLAVLAGGVAHDFNNMLTVIMSSVTLAKIYAQNNAGAISKLNEAEHEIIHARGLTSQLITFARGGAPVKRLASLEGLLRDTVEFSLRGSDIACEYAVAEDLWAAEIDSVQISQVINNLAINARQAMTGGGTLRISAENLIMDDGSGLPLPAGLFVRLSFRDSGQGISPEVMGKIFVPFFTTKKTGTGLGLSTSYSIITQHGGYIHVESGPGEGSVFDVYLPASSLPAPAGVEVEAGTFDCDPAQRGGRILLMDDDDKLRSNVSEMLEVVGYEVETARNGDEALILFRKSRALKRPFSAVILDLTVVGGMGGRECLAGLLELDPMVRAIVMSGYSEDDAIAQYKSCGFGEALTKPFSIEELQAVIRKTTEQAGSANA